MTDLQDLCPSSSLGRFISSYALCVECSPKYTQCVTPIGGLLNLGPSLAFAVLHYA